MLSSVLHPQRFQALQKFSFFSSPSLSAVSFSTTLLQFPDASLSFSFQFTFHVISFKLQASLPLTTFSLSASKLPPCLCLPGRWGIGVVFWWDAHEQVVWGETWSSFHINTRKYVDTAATWSINIVYSNHLKVWLMFVLISETGRNTAVAVWMIEQKKKQTSDMIRCLDWYGALFIIKLFEGKTSITLMYPIDEGFE